jgi:hypothetical protein
MRKKLILLAAGAQVALAIAILPAAASAGEFTTDCEVGASCAYSVQSTGAIVFAGETGETTSCTSLTGAGTLTSGSSTGSVQLTFHGCKELATPFTFACTTPGQSSGTVKSNVMVTHNVYIEPNKTTPGGLVANSLLTFSCGGVNRRFTGNVLGHIENPACNTFQSHHTIVFEKLIEGRQKFTQITTTGTIFELLKNNDAGGVEETVSVDGTAHLTYSSNKAKLTC